MRRVCAALGLLLPAITAFGQEEAAKTAFEAADVHVSPAGTTESGGFLPGGRVEFRATSLLLLISQAYSVPQDRVAGGPPWIAGDPFDVVAKASGAASALAMRAMLQGLLEERFHLKIRREEKPMPVFALVPGKGGRKESAKEGEPDCKGGMEDNHRMYSCHNVTLANLAERLPVVASGYFNLPTVDRTGLKGAYDFTLHWVGRGQLPPGPAGESNSLSIFTSIERELGVKVVRQTAPMPVLAIESVERVPSPNPPGVLDKLGPAPTEFDAADLKPSRPDEQEDFKMNNGRIDARGIAVSDLILFAYNVEDDGVKGGEKWMETDRYNIVAKTAPTESVDTLRTMLQSLLASRFGLKVHQDRQPSSVYALTAGKPKLKEADPAGRSICTNKAADGMRVFTCTNTTVAQFADKLHDAASGYLDHPLVDLTGLKGAYDLTLSFLPARRLQVQNPTAATAAGGDNVAVDRPVGLTLFEAVDKQLGLKISAQKHPMPVIVIDHMNRKPTEN